MVTDHTVHCQLISYHSYLIILLGIVSDNGSDNILIYTVDIVVYWYIYIYIFHRIISLLSNSGITSKVGWPPWTVVRETCFWKCKKQATKCFQCFCFGCLFFFWIDLFSKWIWDVCHRCEQQTYRLTVERILYEESLQSLWQWGGRLLPCGPAEYLLLCVGWCESTPCTVPEVFHTTNDSDHRY